VSATDPSANPPRPSRPTRRLRPEIAAELATRRRQTRLDDLYGKPVQDLEPDELARMRSAFFRG
jgi:hypothetical protein